MTALALLKHIQDSISTIYDTREAANIANYVVVEKYGKLFLRENKQLTKDQYDDIEGIIRRLVHHEPVQYVLGKAWFYGLEFKVNNTVLIPRPETEELVDLLLKENSSKNLTVLDIGTGSGCIAITLKKNRPQWHVNACDISETALQTASDNAIRNGVSVNFFQYDIRQPVTTSSRIYDLIVSNPPYIDPSLSHTLDKNVVAFEPHLALFSPKYDPFFFYKMIVRFAMHNLIKKGRLYFEIPENGCQGITAILLDAGFCDVEVYQDMQGKERMLSGCLA